MPDPATIDRRTLIGVGELATPRWAATGAHQHLRTPGVPSNLVSSTTAQPERLHIKTAPGTSWAVGESGLGLGVGVNEDLRARHHSVSNLSRLSSPYTPTLGEQAGGSRTVPNSGRMKEDDLTRLLALGSLGDFGFDSDMAAALATSLSLSDENTTDMASENKRSTSPSQSYIARPLQDPALARQTSAAQMQSTGSSSTEAGPPSAGSPGSARSRIYARRQERERQTSALAQQTAHDLPLIPQRSTSKFSPPNSADSQTFVSRSGRDVRKTPPSKDRELAPRPRQSPTTTHSDIFKQFAPKDFSHLPPSPSSASINQFLRGSGSINNLGSVSTTQISTMLTAPSYASPTASSNPLSKVSLQQSDSGRVRSMPSVQELGWEGRSIDPETAEALRKLDGLGNTPGKSRPPSKGKSSTSAASISSRPGTPPTKGKPLPAPGGRKLLTKPSAASLKAAEERRNDEEHSPLNAWVDVSDEMPVVPGAVHSRANWSKGSSTALDTLPSPTENRELSSSAITVGTPNSREFQAVPTPSSTSPQKVDPKLSRSSSGDSDVSVYDDAVLGHDAGEEIANSEATVPPVPPLPQGYMSMRHGLSNAAGSSGPSSYVPLRAPSPGTSSPGDLKSPSLSILSETAQPVRPRPMNKKWSFSSALSIRLHSKESSISPSGSPSVPPDQDDVGSPQTPWLDVSGAQLPSPPSQPLDNDDSVYSRLENRPGQSITPSAGSLSVPKPSLSSKRLTPSSIPFFRRASSSSVTSKGSQRSASDTPQSTVSPPSTQRIPSGSQTRRSVLGMHLPSMLRGSASKRGLSEQLSQAPIEMEAVDVEAENQASVGVKGRKRGKVS